MSGESTSLSCGIARLCPLFVALTPAPQLCASSRLVGMILLGSPLQVGMLVLFVVRLFSVVNVKLARPGANAGAAVVLCEMSRPNVAAENVRDGS